MSLDAQIRRAHQQGASLDEICSQLNCDPAAVKWALQDSEDFTDEDCRDMARVIKQIALNGENERNRLTAATYIFDVKKGFRVSKSDTPTVTAIQINQLIHAATQDIAGLLGQPATANSSGQRAVITAELPAAQPAEAAGGSGQASPESQRAGG